MSFQWIVDIALAPQEPPRESLNFHMSKQFLTLNLPHLTFSLYSHQRSRTPPLDTKTLRRLRSKHHRRSPNRQPKQHNRTRRKQTKPNHNPIRQRMHQRMHNPNPHIRPRSLHRRTVIDTQVRQ